MSFKIKYLGWFLILQMSLSFSQNKQAIITYQGEINQKYVDSFLLALENKKDVSMRVKHAVADSYYGALPEDFELQILEDVLPFPQLLIPHIPPSFYSFLFLNFRLSPLSSL